MPISMAATAVAAVLALLAALCSPPAAAAESRWLGEEGDGVQREVLLDSRALVVDGRRRVLFAGEMHYTRSTPEVSVRHFFEPFFSHLLSYVLMVRLDFLLKRDRMSSAAFDQVEL
uniref:Beta-galactosidase n=1 Tax=Arundo donax TaxID=35708 RepID=A0A0A9B348_ARUDO